MLPLRAPLPLDGLQQKYEISYHITYYHINVLQIISTPLEVLVGVITFDAMLISMHDALKGLSKVMAAHCSALCQGEGRKSARLLPLV